MAFGTRARSGGAFMNVSKGFITVKCKEGDEYGDFKAKSYEISAGEHEGEIAYELRFPDVEAHIANIEIVESKNPKYGDNISISMIDKAAESDDRFKKFKLQFGVGSPYFRYLVRCLDNINLKTAVCFEPFYLKNTQRKDSWNSGFSIYQNGQRIEYAISKEDMPEGKEVSRAGKKVWDNDDQVEFLIKKFRSWCKKNKMGEFKPEEDEDEEPEEKPKTKPKAPAHKDVSGDDDDDEEIEKPKSKKRRPVDDDDEDSDY